MSSVPVFTRTFNNLLSPEYSKDELGKLTQDKKEDEQPYIIMDIFPHYPYPKSTADIEIENYFNKKVTDIVSYLPEKKEEKPDLNRIMYRYFNNELKEKEKKAEKALEEEIAKGSQQPIKQEQEVEVALGDALAGRSELSEEQVIRLFTDERKRYRRQATHEIKNSEEGSEMSEVVRTRLRDKKANETMSRDSPLVPLYEKYGLLKPPAAGAGAEDTTPLKLEDFGTPPGTVTKKTPQQKAALQAATQEAKTRKAATVARTLSYTPATRPGRTRN